MRSSLLSTLLIVALVVLAGCTGTTDPATTGPETTGTPVETMTATPTPEPTPEPAVEPGAIDAESIAEDHAAALESAGSFTMQQSTSFEAENESAVQEGLADAFSASRTVRVDLDAGRGVQTNEAFGVERTTYADFEENRTFVRVGDGQGNVTYHSYDSIGLPFESPGASETERAYSGGAVEEWLTNVDFSVVGVEAADGEYVTRLEADGVDDHGELVAWNESAYEEMHTTMLIAEDGIVREIRHEQTTNLTGEPVNATVTIRWTDVGSTTVEEPGWLDDAREETGETAAEETETTN